MSNQVFLNMFHCKSSDKSDFLDIIPIVRSILVNLYIIKRLFFYKYVAIKDVYRKMTISNFYYFILW